MRDGPDISASIQNQAGFSANHQAKRSPDAANIQRLEIGIENQNWLLHDSSEIPQIIARQLKTWVKNFLDFIFD